MEQIHHILKQGQPITLDTNIFVYLLEHHPTYLPIVKEIFESIEKGSCQGYVSVLTLGEILVQPIQKGNGMVENRYKMLFTHFPNLTTVPVDFGTIEIASVIRAKHNLTMNESIIAATSIQTNSCILLTNNKRITRVQGIEVVIVGESSASADEIANIERRD